MGKKKHLATRRSCHQPPQNRTYARHLRVLYEPLDSLIQEQPPGCPICSRALLTVPHCLIQCIDMENARSEHFENTNNLTLKSLLGDSALIDKLMAYLQNIGVFSEI